MSSTRLLVILVALACLPTACGDDPKQMVAVAQCGDGEDNDADGKIDFPDDPGCTAATDDSEDTPTAAQCGDGRDNDADGKVDYPLDPGCSSPNQDDELDDCPSGPNCPQCSNGIDDDQNGSTDYPADAMGCSSAADPEELVNDPVACGAGLMIKNLPANGMDTGTLVATSTSSTASACGGGFGALAIAYAINVPRPSVIVASTVGSATTADTVLDIRSADCDAATAEVACNDNVSVDTIASTVTASVPAGRYYIIVQGYDASVTGAYELTVEVFAGEGTACATTDECGPGLVCRMPVGQTAMVCSKPACSDGLDDDTDTKIDYPADPGCASPSDDTENDNCPSGPDCPACSNGVDDDNDQQVDYPLDPSCAAASGMTEACTGEADPIGAITSGTATGTTVGAANNHDPSCGSSTISTGGDILFTLAIPAVTSLTIDTDTSAGDTVLSLLSPTCAEPSLACDDDSGSTTSSSLVETGALAAGTYIVAVDAFSSDAADVGGFTIHVSGVLESGQSCELADTLNGALVCPATNPCVGTVGARICQPSACGDGIDNDNDQKTDYPDEPGCASRNDDDETDSCPGVGCPVCANGVDDDNDTATDYPLDTSCASASGDIESCNTEQDPIIALTGPTTTGAVSGAHDDHMPSCTTGTGGLDRVYTLTVPALSSLTVDNNSTLLTADVVLSVLPASCTGAALGCSDEGAPNGGGGLVTLGPVAAGTYVVVVDGYSDATSGRYALNVSGVLQPGSSCEPAATLNGALTCPVTSLCSGAVGSRVCTASQCSDGIDNNGGGLIDYPNDPGCTDPLDSTEETAVTACSNAADDDTDSAFDYASDLSCWAAASDDEAFCNVETDRVVQIVGPTTTGTTAALNDDQPTTSCQADASGSDQTFALVLPVPVATLTVDTDNTQFDTVLTWRTATCAELVCDDDGGLGVQSQLALTAVTAGTYAVTVDGYGAESGAFELHVHGTVASGTACTSSLFATGVLTCAAGSCTNGLCP